MTLKSLAVLSNKGGVGKTSIAVNIAVHLANNGKNVVLLENDFHAPSLMTFSLFPRIASLRIVRGLKRFVNRATGQLLAQVPHW